MKTVHIYNEFYATPLRLSNGQAQLEISNKRYPGRTPYLEVFTDGRVKANVVDQDALDTAMELLRGYTKELK